MALNGPLDGIWTGEILGPYGWENSGVYVLEGGRILGGNNRHYSSGTFQVTDGVYTAKIAVHYYGQPRAIFGSQQTEFEIEVAGEVKADVIDATVTRPERAGKEVHYRMTKRTDIPAA